MERKSNTDLIRKSRSASNLAEIAEEESDELLNNGEKAEHSKHEIVLRSNSHEVRNRRKDKKRAQSVHLMENRQQPWSQSSINLSGNYEKQSNLTKTWSKDDLKRLNSKNDLRQRKTSKSFLRYLVNGSKKDLTSLVEEENDNNNSNNNIDSMPLGLEKEPKKKGKLKQKLKKSESSLEISKEPIRGTSASSSSSSLQSQSPSPSGLDIKSPPLLSVTSFRSPKSN